MASGTGTNTVGYASFQNLFGIFVSIVLCVLYLALGAHTLKYMKAFACKIKIIMARAQDKAISKKNFNYKT
jgi:hypothetical protein